MPAESEKQRRFMGAELARKRAGKKTRTGMTESQLSDYAKMPPIKGKKPHGSGPFSAEDMKRGYKKGMAVDHDDLHDAWQPPAVDEYGATDGKDKAKNVGSDYE